MAADTLAVPILVVPPPQKELPPNPDYTVRVRLKDGAWQSVYLNSVLVLQEFHNNEQGHDDHAVNPAAVAIFDFRGEVEVEVIPAYATANTFTIRPLSKNIPGSLDNNVIRFNLTQPAKLVVAINGDKAHELHLFANAPETNVPKPATPNVKYFPPGVHTLDPFEYKLKSNETVYLAPGAIVHGQFSCLGIHDAAIRGRGIIDQSDRFTPGGRKGSNGLDIRNSSNITIDGISLFDSVGYHIMIGQSRNITIRNTNSFSVSQWADGIDEMSSSHITIDNVFVRSSDDCIALYCGRWMFKGDSTDISVSNSILWADVAHPIFLGCHAIPAANENLQRITFKNIDILEHHQPGPGYQGCMAINAGDNIAVHDVRFEDIRIEPFTMGQLVNLSIFKNGAYNDVPGRVISNILFKDIKYTSNATGESPSHIEGFDNTRCTQNIRFENLCINGKVVTDADAANIVIGPHTRDIVFATPSVTPR